MTLSLRTFSFPALLLLLVALTPHSATAQSSGASADALWKKIVAMDGGPKTKAATSKEAAENTRSHLTQQINLLVEFQKNHPSDPRIFDAVMKEAGLTASLGTLVGDERLVDRALAKATALAKSKNLSAKQAADADFQRVTILFLKARGKENAMRESIVNASRNFHARFPGDPRGPRLLAEAATVCDATPKVKRELIQTALRDTKEPPLRMRLEDDLRQLDLVGQKVPFEFIATDGQPFSLQQVRGKVAVVIFWAADSPHSLFWLARFMQDAKKFPAGGVAIATVSLDTDRKRMEAMRKDLGITAPTAFDGKGWESPLARKFGINGLPTVWIFDKEGRLRAANAKDDYARVIQRLSAEN